MGHRPGATVACNSHIRLLYYVVLCSVCVPAALKVALPAIPPTTAPNPNALLSTAVFTQRSSITEKMG